MMVTVVTMEVARKLEKVAKAKEEKERAATATAAARNLEKEKAVHPHLRRVPRRMVKSPGTNRWISVCAMLQLLCTDLLQKRSSV